MIEDRASISSVLSVVSFLIPAAIWAWLAMMFTHEMGHVIGAWVTGGLLSEVELRPGRVSHSLVQPNPQPDIVLWSGFLVGWITPQLTVFCWKMERGLIGPVLRIWAGFCLLAGGVYLAIGGNEKLTDTGQLVALGWSLWMLVAIGLAVAAVGYWQSRAAWLALAKRIEARGVSWRVAFGWWIFLAGWWAAQHALAITLEP